MDGNPPHFEVKNSLLQRNKPWIYECRVHVSGHWFETG
jgi:hypothetical protein